MKALILAGGTGKRLWPVSRRKQPKQFKPLLGKKSLVKSTYDRIKKGFKTGDIFISINQEQRPGIIAELGKSVIKNLIIEPEKKGTAAAIGLACAWFKPGSSRLIRKPATATSSSAGQSIKSDETSFLTFPALRKNRTWLRPKD